MMMRRNRNVITLIAKATAPIPNRSQHLYKPRFVAPAALNLLMTLMTLIGYSLREHWHQNGRCCRPKMAIKNIQSTLMLLL